ncbi:MAG: PilZ domain-containing protein [Nitrospiraceae bacterium]|nr:PilZ domain-containing protein [Nitrospiraceae bacterium]MBX9845905.1 PilZ domain-containing protein [Xanthobacteraceae bacterium]
MAERRMQMRSRTLKTAQIVFNERRSVLDCIVRNTSSVGACLQIAHVLELPDRFMLRMVSDQHQFSCEVKWRRGERVVTVR